MTSTRHIAAAALVAAAAALYGGTARAADRAQDPPQVTVREDGGVYTVTARFDVPQPSSTAFAVLTDYEGIPRFMPHVKTSIVRARFAGGALVEQEAVSRVLMFSKRVHLLLEVEEDAGAVRFRDASGRSFAHYAGAWLLVEHDGVTAITYELTAQPSFDVPEFLLVRLLKRDAAQMIERLRSQMASPGLQQAEDRP